MGVSPSWATQFVNDLVIAIANWSTAVAVVSIRWLVAGLGKASEPDLSVIVPVYDRVLAISLLLLGAVVAIALVERIASGSNGIGISIVVRVIAATFCAYVGLATIKYVGGYAALLATVWTPDFANLNSVLIHNVVVSDAVVEQGGTGPYVSTFGLILTALSVSSLTVMVHLELVVRSALILTVSAFVPLVAVLAIWARAAGAAATLAEFLLGLFLSKFVVATVVYVGFRLVVVALTSTVDTDTTENWMASGLAVLLIAAFSPLVIFSALRFAHTQAGSVARGFTGATIAMAPVGKMVGWALGFARNQVGTAVQGFSGASAAKGPAGKVGNALGKAVMPVVRSAQKRLGSRISRLRSRK